MQDKIIHENMVGILENITEIISHITRSSFPYRQLDIDYLMEQIRNLYDEVYQLNKLNQQWLNQQISDLTSTEPTEYVKISNTEQSTTIVTPSTQTASQTNGETSEPQIPLQTSEPTSTTLTTQTSSAATTSQNNIVQPHIGTKNETQTTKPTTQETQILAEKYLGRYKAINEHLARQRQFTENKIDRPIKNLRTEISLNDKFMFIQSIFKNNAEEYDRFIAQVENSPTVEHALEFARNYIEQKVPNLEENISSLLYKYIQRRFKT